MATQANNPPVPAEQKPVVPPPALTQIESARQKTPFADREKMFVEQGLAPAPEQPSLAQDSPPAGAKADEPPIVKPEPTGEAVAKPEEPTPTPAPEKTATPEPPRLYAGKYKSVEELERAYKEAQTTIVKQGTKVNQTLEEMARDAQKAKEAAPLAAAPDDMPDPVLDPAGFKQWQVNAINRVRYEQIAQERFSKAANEFNEQYKDLVDAKAMEWVNSRLMIDQRFVQGYQKFLQDPINYDLNELRSVATEHANYVREMVGNLRVAGRMEERQKQAEIMPQLTTQSPERPAQSGTPSTPEDAVDEMVRTRREFLQKRGVAVPNR